MRKLLIKLVAIETALVGWLSYWLFLVYANNPSIADQLAGSLQKFPQLSFSTIDIAVLVIIAALAVTLGFKFQRGLRPGIRLERALQMLENLMKRNLILESQVAELKIERTHPLPSPPIQAAPAPPTISSSDESRTVSWEKAFRTPLEAGPAIPQKTSAPPSNDTPFGRQTGIPPIRIEPKIQPVPSEPPKATIILDEKGSSRSPPPPTIIPNPPDKPPYVAPPTASSWEDSPKFIGESKGILTPSLAPRKAPTVSESGGLKQPYIPAPAPKMSPSLVVGPTTSPVAIKPPPAFIQPRVLPKSVGRSVASPKAPTFPGSTLGSESSNIDSTQGASSTALSTTPSVSSTEIVPKPDPFAPRKPEGVLGSEEKTRVKDSQPTKKKSSTEDSKN